MNTKLFHSHLLAMSVIDNDLIGTVHLLWADVVHLQAIAEGYTRGTVQDMKDRMEALCQNADALAAYADVQKQRVSALVAFLLQAHAESVCDAALAEDAERKAQRREGEEEDG